MMIIGLTGGIGSGKSTVAELFKKLGVPVIDADIFARQICEPGASAYNTVIDHFGAGILDDGGHINRKKLRDIIFAHDLEREWLEAALHPIIRREMHTQAETFNSPYCIFVIPLLTESNNLDGIDRILVVDAPEALQIERASKRDHTSMDDIEKIMSAQNSRGERLTYADDVILNDVDIAALERKVAKLHESYTAMARR